LNYHYWCRQLYSIINKSNFGFNIKLYNERRIHSENYDDIYENNTILFKHYWRYKIIPLYITPYTLEFTKIYNTQYWINGSGTGSYIQNTKLYNTYMTEFIIQNNIHSITDIGCGDWQSSYLIYDRFENIDYTGIDCVSSVIQNNKKNHPKYKFHTIDILCNIDSIKDSDLYVIKDVLQHWKLQDIYNFLDQLVTKNYKYIIITNNGHQTQDNIELTTYIGNGRGLHSNYLPLKKYNASLLLDYTGDEYKHMCIIKKDYDFIRYTEWNHYNKSELNMFDYRILNTYTIPNQLRRVGPSEDGGYIIVDGFEYDLFISGGISTDIRFEDAFLNTYKVPCIAFDGTINVFPAHKNSIEWIPKNIGYSNTEKTTNLKEYIQNYNNIFLKMDVEGSEFNWLDSMSTEKLDKFNQIVLEVHWPFDMYRMNMIKKLNKTHYIIHIHGNNYCARDLPNKLKDCRTYDGTIIINNSMLGIIKLPEVFEVTYVNKRLCDTSLVEIKEIHFPTNLDYPNNPGAPDISFSIPVATLTGGL
jgi:hypothetical protein